MDYKSPRALHSRRLLDITWGSVLNSAKTKIQKLRLGSTIRNGWSVADFNEAIRTNMPNIYVIDTKFLASVILESYNIPIDSNIDKLAEIIHSRLSTEPRHKISLQILENLATKIHTILLDKLALLVNKEANYLSYRKAAAMAGAEVRRELNLYKFALIKDPENFINNSTGKIVLLSHSFEYLKSEVNKVIKTCINVFRAANKDISNSIPIDVKVGDIFHSGHAGLYSDNTFLGINMPAQLINGIVGNKFAEVEEAIGSIDTHVEYGVQISKSFKSSGVLLDLGFQFTVIMSKSTNEGLWKNKESKAIYEKVKQVTIDQLTNVFKSRESIEALVNIIEPEGANIRTSPTMTEYIINILSDNIVQGKSSREFIGIVNTPKLKELLSKKSGAKTAIQSRPQKLATSTKAPIRNKQGQFTSLASLQILLNQALPYQIRKNMMRPALQNQTGRFADSVNVEKVSQSREGMITAFYNYMKSPYQTFEPGFRQGSEARNPKTLISKSIREIATGLVGNRLRAVRL